MKAKQAANSVDQRQVALQLWFENQAQHIANQLGLATLPAATLVPASTDASFRRYFRWQSGIHSLILMDAPPEQENSAPFVQIAQLLAQHKLHVPKILAQDLAQGFLVISDLGQQTWLEFFQTDNANLAQADALFAQAIDCLLQMQQITPDNLELPQYDRALLERELDLFKQWFVGQELGLAFNQQQQQLWQQTCDLLVNNALQQSNVLVHRDFMPRNLMLSTPNPGLIDFQDAVIGPISYDVICLFKDAFISWPQAQIQRWLELYWQRARELKLGVPSSFADFARDCCLIGAQRHLKVLGIFARICHRDAKPRYLADAGRFVLYLQQAIEQYPRELDSLRQLLESLPLEKYTA